MGKEYSQPPSKLLHLDDPFISWCLDEAVFLWGNFVENELERAADQGKTAEQRMDYRKQMMEHLMDGNFTKDKPEEAEDKPRPTGFRDPAMLVKGKAS